MTLVLDVSAIARWVGPAVGIIRVEQELAAYAAAHRPDITLALFDPSVGAFRALRPRWRDAIIGFTATIDMSHAEGIGMRQGWRRLVPSRYPVVMLLERWRRRFGARGPGRAFDALQRLILSVRRHSTPLADAHGRRYDIIQVEEGLGPPLSLTSGDRLLTVGPHRPAAQVETIAALQRQTGFALIALCYDLIPLLFPDCFYDTDVATFAAYWARMFPICETVLVTSASAEQDVRAHCLASFIAVPHILRIPLGYRPPEPQAQATLPDGLEPDRFALFVGTLEPRKGHAMLVAAWRSLLARGVPQAHRFRLVFVGRAGWKVDALLRNLADPGAFEGTLLHLTAIDDATLAALYCDAAFCLFPSLYEGFGLPIVEAFAYGKPVIASTGGAVPETAGAFAPCLDPRDTEAWAAHIEAWITDPTQPAAIAERLRAEFRHPGWDEAASDILGVALRKEALLF